MPTGTCGKPYSPLSLVWVQRLTPVASSVAGTFTLASTAPLASATRPRMRPPVLWADVSVEQIRHRLSTKFKKPNQLDIRDDLDNGMTTSSKSGAILLRSEFHGPTFQRTKYSLRATLTLL